MKIRLALTALASILAISTALAGCTDIETITLTLPEPISEPGLYRVSGEVTLADGSAYDGDYLAEIRFAGDNYQPDPADLINVNTASVEDLESLPGIGPVYAQRIIDGRPYNTLDDLLAVKGIGPKTLLKIKYLVTCD